MIAFLDRKIGQCAYPLWTRPNDDKMVCGEPVQDDDKPYCACHMKLSYTPTTRSDRSVIRLAARIGDRETRVLEVAA